MVWTAPATYASAELLNATKLDLVSANLASLRNGNDQLVKLYLANSPSIANNTDTKLSWGTVARTQIGSIWSAGQPTRLVAPVAGWYLVLVNVEWRSNSTNLRNISLIRNSPALQLDLQSQGAVGGKSNLSAMALVLMNASAYLEVQVFQSSGAGLTAHGGTEDRTRVAMVLVGTAGVGAWPAAGPRTWSLADGTPTHTLLNAQVRDPLLTLRNLNDCAAKVHRTSASQSIANNTRTAVSWQASSSTAGATPPWVVGSPTRFTPPVDGKYECIGNAKWASNSSGRRGLSFRVNGTTNHDLQFQESNGVDTCTGMKTLNLLSTDYVEMVVFQDSGGSLNLVGGSEQHSTASFRLAGTGSVNPPLWTPPRDWVDGVPEGILSPGRLNTEWRDHLINLRSLKGAGAGIYLADNQSVEATQRAPLSWGTVEWNVGGIWASGSQMVVPVSGWYLINPNVEWDADSNADGVRGVGYVVNGSATKHDLQYQEGNAKQLNLSGADLIYLKVGEVVEAFGYEDSGESLSIHGGNPDQTHASLQLMAAA